LRSSFLLVGKEPRVVRLAAQRGNVGCEGGGVQVVERWRRLCEDTCERRAQQR